MQVFTYFHSLAACFSLKRRNDSGDGERRGRSRKLRNEERQEGLVERVSKPGTLPPTTQFHAVYSSACTALKIDLV